MPLASRLRGLPRYEPWIVLGPLVVVQWLALVAFVLTVRHNGWLFYQGGDQTFFYTSSWTLSHGHIPDAAIGWGWSYLLIPVSAVFGPNFLAALPAIVLIQTLILLPLALYAVYAIVARFGGRVLGYWAAACWVAAPYLAIPLFDHRYHQKYVEQFLPQALGLSGLGDFPSMVCLLVAALFVVRALEGRRGVDAAAAGLLVGFAIGIKPANALFLAGPALAFLLGLRFRSALLFGAALVPPLLALALWKERGLGHLPLLSSAPALRLAAGALFPQLPAASISHYVKLDWGQYHDNADNLREFFWSVRVVQWLPLAGVVAVARRSVPVAALLGGWLGAFLLVKGTSPQASIQGGTFFRLFMPGFPAFFLLAVSIPLLVPTFGQRFAGRFPSPLRDLHWRNRWLLGAAALLGIVPIALFGGLPQLSGRSAAKYFDESVFLPMTSHALRLDVASAGGVRRLSWTAPPASATTFYRVFRSPAVAPYDQAGFPPGIQGVRCLPPTGGASDCSLEMDVVATQRARTLVDSAHLGAGRYTYRVAAMANWIDDPAGGDVMLVSDPVDVQVP